MKTVVIDEGFVSIDAITQDEPVFAFDKSTNELKGVVVVGMNGKWIVRLAGRSRK